MVGCPNVGKSTTVNALVGGKKVAVGETPGKTKHFQTIMMEDENMVICDCPGLIFPTLSGSRAELVCGGILRIDEMRDPFPPVRFHRAVLSSRACCADACPHRRSSWWRTACRGACSNSSTA